MVDNNTPIHFVVVIVGSKGDLFPLLAVGEEMRRRGHRVTVIAPIIYDHLASKSDLDFIPLSAEEDHRASSKDKVLLNTRYQSLFYLRHAVSWNLAIYQSILRKTNETLVILAVDRPHLWADLVAHSKLRAPVVRFLIDLPFRAEWAGDLATLPPSRVLRDLSLRWQMEWCRRSINLGLNSRLSTVPRMLRSIRSRIPMVPLYPAWLTGNLARNPDSRAFSFLRPRSCEVPPRHSSNQTGASRDLLIFVVGTDGAVADWEHRFCKVSIAICEELGYSGIVLGGDCGRVPPEGLPNSIEWRSFVPLGEVLPRAAAIIHHGGIGTAAAAIEYGVPQLVVPRVFAQPINAEWLRRLGLCIVMEPCNYTVRGGVDSIRVLVQDSAYRSRALQYAPHCYVKEDVHRLGSYLEDWFQRAEVGKSPGH